MKPILKAFYILALNTNDEKESHILLHEGLTNRQFKRLQGSYKGQKEQSYLIPARFKSLVTKLAGEYNQESVLFVDETREAFLVYTESGKRESIGMWQETNNTANREAFTVDIETGKIYIAA